MSETTSATPEATPRPLQGDSGPSPTGPTEPPPKRWHAGYVRGTFHRSPRRRIRVRYAQINRLADLGLAPEEIKRTVAADNPGEEQVVWHEVDKVMAARGVICERLEDVAEAHVADALGEIPYTEGESEHRGKQRLSILTGVRVLQPGGAQVAVSNTQDNHSQSLTIITRSEEARKLVEDITAGRRRVADSDHNDD